MEKKICLSLIEEDDDYENIQITIFNGLATFTSFIYINVGGLESLIFVLNKFKAPTYINGCPIALGSFDSNTAGGALKALLTVTPDGLIQIDATLMSNLEDESGHKQVRQFVLIGTLKKLDQFIDELGCLLSGTAVEANFDLLD